MSDRFPVREHRRLLRLNMYYNRDAREKLIKWNVSFLFISDKIQIWNALALFVGKKLGFPPLLKKHL